MEPYRCVFENEYYSQVCLFYLIEGSVLGGVWLMVFVVFVMSMITWGGEKALRDMFWVD